MDLMDILIASKLNGGGGGTTDPSVVFITGTYNASVTPALTLDKTFSEIKAILDNGQLPIIACTGYPDSGGPYYFFPKLNNPIAIEFWYIGNTVDKDSTSSEITHHRIKITSQGPTIAGDAVRILYKDKTATLQTGETSLTITDASITTNSTIDYYTSIYGVNPTNAVVTTGQIVLTFDAQESDMNVKVRIW